ncbi:universal stress protein [Pseudonocardia asaccharolytica]|uniref:Universal stress protein n=1 Tax=Pseudonocardia asaccharolytica DSM 44247 = NBRC 16224 TaxID=1123024 RepID=A0A511D6G7_9PSEU|nr:universal stress protein [Pseudonocardia asaccharolytica]GEL20375.1 universal stress protein [Pseudonocardia asaccharolytica DSM 44247 = NBRC 16224]
MAEQRAWPVVVGVDGSEPALDAVRWAAREAAVRGAPLRLVGAFVWTGTPHIGDLGLGETYLEGLWDTARGHVETAAGVARSVAPGVTIEQDVRAGYAVPVLCEESERARLVVVGSRGLGGFTGLLVGSVAVGLAAHASSPVVVVRGALPEESSAPVAVGVDGSPVSEAALAFAFEAASWRGVPLVAVHTWSDVLLDPTLVPLLDWDAIEADERQVLAERLAGWSGKYPDVQVRRVVVRDRPAKALVEWSGEAQLVVVGSRGRGGVAGALLGSVSQTLLRHAHCPVAVVRSGGAEQQPS